MRPRHMAFLLTTQTLLVACALAAGKVAAPPAVIVHSPDAGAREQLAAREVRRYVYLRTGQLLPIRAGLPAQGDAILVGVKDRELFKSPGGAGPPHEAIGRLGPQQYLLRTVAAGGRRLLLVVGGDDVGTLYGAYRLAECLGVRFFLHGDVVPDQQMPWEFPDIDETGKPLFELRGLNPWGSHPFGLDLWNTDDWKAHIGQLAKLRMNFIGAHCYPEGHPYAEPTVWTGLPGDFDEQGRVAFSYPTLFYTALFRPPWGGLKAGKTSAYHLGAAMLFDRDDWGPDVMRGHAPRPTAPAACNEVFNRTAAMFREAFTFARLLGVKTCLGTEAPLIVPRAVRERLKQQGKNPADPAVVQEVYEGMFRRIMAAHPLDYYWLWTPESWTWKGNTAAQLKATVEDVRIAREALRTVGAPFRLGTCGWVLGPANDRAALDRMMPQEIALSAIGRHLGEDPVDPAFGRVKRRDKWAIPWMEGDNGGLAIPQLWVGRTRQDAADARAYGCTGLMGLMWRTRVLGPNIAALAQAGWAQPWNRRRDEPGAPAVQPEGAQDGKVANYPGAAIARTDDDALYQTCRYDLHGYVLDVPNGACRVTLKFCEPHFGSAGKRVCDVKLQGKTVLAKLDVFAKVGKFAALDHTFDEVRVTDGRLRIELVYRTSLPCISAIAIERKGFARRINCGGPAHGDYAADFPVSAPAGRARKVPCEDFYADWARALFGREAAPDIAAIFARIDSRLPRPLSRGCPAGVRADKRPWKQVAPAYVFVDELVNCRTKVTGPGSLERFDYWLNTMKYLRAGAKLDCAVGRFHVAMARAKGDKALAARDALPAYRAILAAYREAFQHLLSTASTNGGLATIMFWEHGFHPVALEQPVKLLTKTLGTPLQADSQPSEVYAGPPRLIVPTVRTSIEPGEALTLKVIVLAKEAPRGIALHWRPMGEGRFATVPMSRVARGVHTATFPPGGAKADLEYYVEARADGQVLRFPATAPTLNQTLVTLPDPRR